MSAPISESTSTPSTPVTAAPVNGPVIDPKTGQKTWSVGTLTYTSGGIVALFLWLLWGDFAWSMRDRSAGPMSQWYLNSLGVPKLLFGLLVSSFPALVALILGPVISMKSDRHRGKWGRRIPFLLVTTPAAALGMIGLAVTPFIAKWMHGAFGREHVIGAWLHENLDTTKAGAWLLAQLQNEMVVAVVCFAVFWAAFEFATIAGSSVFGGLINDVVPRPLLGRFYGLFRAVSLIDGMIFNYWIFGLIPDHFTLILLVIGVFYGVAFMWVCLKVKESDYPPPPPLDKVKPAGTGTWLKPGMFTGFIGGARVYFRECFTSPYYVSVFVMLMTAGLAFAPVNIYAIPYSKGLGVSEDTYGKFLALTYLISLSLAWFLGWMADRFHPLRMAMATLLGYMLVTAWGAVFAKTPGTFLVAWVLHGVLTGSYFTSAASLGPRLFPHSRFAQFSSAAGICSSVAGMVLAPTVGLIIDRTGDEYRHTFTTGCLLATIALVCAVYVYRQFMNLGGPKDYVAPGE
ncbi:MFS transporter [Opitutaceae bacterium TAV5]|nr:MFS transporter [Opitutaceae bacterium TAV5]